MVYVLQSNLCIVVTVPGSHAPPHYSHLRSSNSKWQNSIHYIHLFKSGHLSIVATDFWPKGDHYRQVPLYTNSRAIYGEN